MRIVLWRIGVRMMHRRLRRRMVIGVGVVLLLPPRLGIHGRPRVHVLAWPGRHVMIVHHVAGGEASGGGGHRDLSRRGEEERRSAFSAGPAPTLMRLLSEALGMRKSVVESRAHHLVVRTFFG